MDLEKIDEILAAESEVFTTTVRLAIKQVTACRCDLKLQVSQSLHLDVSEEMSEQAFFAVMDEFEKISGNLAVIISLAGFDADVGKSWLTKQSAPRATFRRAVAKMLLDVVIDHYADGKLLLDMDNLAKELGQLETVGTPPNISRSKLLSQLLDDCSGYGDLSVRVRNAIKNYDILALGELVARSEGEMLYIPNFSRKSLIKVVSFLSQYGLTLGELSADEEKEVATRRVLNENADRQLVTVWHGDIKDMYKDASPQVRQQSGENIFERVVAYPKLINALKKVGIRYCTELATAPQELLKEICDGHEGWIEQLPLILNGVNKLRRTFEIYYRLDLGMTVPPYLNEDVKTYKAP